MPSPEGYRKTKRLMEQAGYREVECVQDFAGLDRVVFGTLW